ncbi:Stk1 family PASTA domain-containing Ser/Thr kinase [Paenibacillus sp. MZ04-78.2]|uniref:Stk1 family PASTA domain-containing Ser/Thr kinase n=1 Tax=Paenibacillus sp. MZ04-78.2 TaxID=2962034 RepID=UPI0020B6D97E|nr:Stk1 family PASTA domain-containing Ser/Thr kinase [Paenibacillus sp. MZ04-78.2]MCP3771768.1 Stk1 family PASTA domain-containing Ser/Thr kinase [Paenibacillus sp. MZ04-78.2]
MIGKQLGGRYEILGRVGGGGMAIVYKGLDILLHRHVAVKVLRQQYVHDEEFIQRFRREAQAAASLSHPNVVSIYDVGQEEDIHYIVMEYVEGTNLNEQIKEIAPLQVEEAVHIASQICDALDHAHHNQIIHRDIKPHNILIGKNGRVKVTDFGIARAVTSSTITQTGSVVGSVHYFSPEHAKGTPTGEQSDLYSLGIVMYQMLTGRLPFLGESPISVALKHLQEDVEEPRKVNPLIPQSVENIILRAMRKSTSERYRSAKDMMSDLESCLLPHRRNEPKVNFLDDDELDEEKTRVMPALRPGQYAVVEDDDDAPRAKETPPPEKQKKGWVKPLVWFVVLMALVGGMWYAVKYVQQNLTVQRVDIPNVVDKPLAEAKKILEDSKLQVEADYQNDDAKPKDIVIQQSQANNQVIVGTMIKLTVSAGPTSKKMPDVTNLKLADAKTKLVSSGFDLKNIKIDQQFLEAEPETVTSQKPAPNEEYTIPDNIKVELTVSKGRETFKMPNLIGKTENEAKTILSAKDLKLSKDGIVRQPSYKQSKGRVTKQFPFEPDDDVMPGTEITLTVSSGLPPEAGQMTVPVQIKPSKEGQAGTAKVILSDAAVENSEYQKLTNVTKTETLEVKLVVSPDKDATIQIRGDNIQNDSMTITYKDYQDQKSGNIQSNSAGTSPNADTGTNGGGKTEQSATPASGTGGASGKPVKQGSGGTTSPPTGQNGGAATAPAGNTTGTGGTNP